MSNGPFGLEHPLVTVRDLEATAGRYRRLGFDPTPMGRHPWGTLNRLVMFPDNFIELIAVGDPAAIEADPVGGHVFGRRVRDSLALGEGISLLALRSHDAPADEQTALARGAASAGRIDFRRPVTLPDGTRDEAVVTLVVLPDDRYPRLSAFLCHQHKPHLVWTPGWLEHRNGATRISAVTYLADRPGDVAGRFRQVWGTDAVRTAGGGFAVETAGGRLDLVDRAGLAARFPGMALPEGAEARLPCGVAISVATARFDDACALVRDGAPEARIEARRILVPAAFAGGVILEIHPAG